MAEFNPLDAGSKMISNGIDEFAIGLGDDMLNMSNGLVNSSSSTDNLILQISTFTYNPFKDPSIIHDMGYSFAIYFLFVLAFIFLAGAYVMISSARGTRLLLGQVIHNIGMSRSEYFTMCAILILIPPFVAFIMWIPLIVNYILTSLLMSSILPSIMPSPDNVVLYLGMCVVYVMMLFAFIWRTIVIGLSVKFAFFILLLIVIPVTRKLGWWIFIYYLIMVFLQVIIIACTIGGVGILTYITGGHNVYLPGYFVLGAFLATIALIFIFGPLTIMRLLQFGKRMVLRL